MVKIRLAKLGKKNDHFFRVVAIDSQKKNNGRALFNFGYWDPRKNETKIDVKSIAEWVKKGAQVSPTVAKLISK